MNQRQGEFLSEGFDSDNSSPKHIPDRVMQQVDPGSNKSRTNDSWYEPSFSALQHSTQKDADEQLNVDERTKTNRSKNIGTKRVM